MTSSSSETYKRNDTLHHFISCLQHINMEGPMENINMEGPMDIDDANCLQMKYFKVVATKTEKGRNCFELINDKNDPPLRMFRNQMARLGLKLERAQQVARECGPDTPDQTVLIDTVSRYQSVYVRLLVDTFKGMSYIWLRLYFEDELTKAIVPSRRGVQLSLEDDAKTLMDFVRHHTQDEIHFEESKPLIMDKIVKQ